MAHLGKGDRVIWLGALDANGEPKGGWAGNGKGVIADYEPNRRYFRGGPPQKDGEPCVGPAVGILLDNGDPNSNKKFDIWVTPSSLEIILDEAFAVNL